MALTDKLTAIADEVRELSGTSETLTLDAMASNIGDVNSEITTQSDLLDQVAVALEDKTSGGGDNFPIGDGNTHIWISLAEGRTSPMLGVCPKGTVTVDWGDGTEPDVLTGTSVSTVMWTPTHNYAKAGDYVITLTVDGVMTLGGSGSERSYILRHSSSKDGRNRTYQNSVRKIEVGQGVLVVREYAFYGCMALTNVVISSSVTTISSKAFYECYGVTLYDFTSHTTVPALGSVEAFYGIPDDCKIRVPAALYDEWIAATNWSSLASQIVAV